MSEIRELGSEELAFLEDFMPRHDNGELPYVTLTWAQSLDGMIALRSGVRTALSGLDSKSMTHYLRARHDAILVGSNTARTDNPALNCRYPGAKLADQPQPIILDQHGRWADSATQSKVYDLAKWKQGKYPMRIAEQRSTSSFNTAVETDQHTGITSLYVPASHEPPNVDRLSWEEILVALKRQGINSVMIEGGGLTIQELLAKSHLVSATIITIAPTFLGSEGVSVSPAENFSPSGEHINAAWVNNSRSCRFGNDIVLCGQLDAQYIPPPPPSPPPPPPSPPPPPPSDAPTFGRAFDIAMR